MASEEDLTLRMRTKGARPAKRDVDSTAASVKGLGAAAERTNRHAGLLGRTTHGLLSPFRHLRGEAVGLAKSFVGIGLAFGSIEGIKRSIETTDNLVKTTVQLRNQFGLTTEAASGLAGVMAARDLAPQGLRMGLITLAKQMHAVANGNDAAAEAFHYVGITADDVRDGLASPDGLMHIFERVTGRLTDMHGGADKAAYGQILLGRATKSLAPLLQEGALGLEQQLKWAKEFGVTLDGHTVGSVEDLAASQTKAQYAALGLQIQLGQLLAPALTDVNNAFSDVVQSFRDGRPEGGKFARTVYQIGHDLEPVGEALEDVGGFLKDHPALLQASVVALIAWKTGFLKLITFPGVAAARGYITGRAYAAGLARGTMSGGAAQAAGRGWFGGFKATAGGMLRTWLPPVVGVTVAIDFAYHINKWLADILNIPADGTSQNTFNKITNPGGVVAGNLLHGRNLTSGLGPKGSSWNDRKWHGMAFLPGDPRDPTTNTPITANVGPGGRIIGFSSHRKRAGRFHVGQHVGVNQTPTGVFRAYADTLGALERALSHVVIENHVTTNIDGKTAAKSVHRAALRAKAVR